MWSQTPAFLSWSPFSFPLFLPLLSLFLSQIFRSLTGVDKASGHTTVEGGRSACLNVQNGPESMFVRLYKMAPKEWNSQVTQALPSHLFSLVVLGWCTGSWAARQWALLRLVPRSIPGRCSTTELYPQIPSWPDLFFLLPFEALLSHREKQLSPNYCVQFHLWPAGRASGKQWYWGLSCGY